MRCFRLSTYSRHLAAAALAAALVPAVAQEAQPEQETQGAPGVQGGQDVQEPERFAVHGQTTYIWQRKPAFDAAYSGENSLGTERAKSYSFSGTLDLGLRLWQGAEFHFNPEVAQGVPFSELHGVGGPSNGELGKASSTSPVFYRARAFVRQTWGLGGGSDAVDSDFNQLSGAQDKRRVVLTIGNYSILDIFDQNDYGSDPRSQFMNWSFLTHGSFDYAADTRGYTWGATLEYVWDDWSVRFGHFLQPIESNGRELDSRMFEHYGQVLELEKRYALSGLPGATKLLVWRNKARMGRYDDAIALGAATGTVPDVGAVRAEHAKTGVGLSVLQQVSRSAGVFFRANMSDDQTETYSFTEIGRQVAAGGVLKGAAWGRGEDEVGLAFAINMLGANHRAYLAAGGLGAFLGDGQLSYRPEQVMELYYNFRPVRFFSITPDFQYIRNPGYNGDRGPAKFYGVRFHAEF